MDEEDDALLALMELATDEFHRPKRPPSARESDPVLATVTRLATESMRAELRPDLVAAVWDDPDLASILEGGGEDEDPMFCYFSGGVRFSKRTLISAILGAGQVLVNLRNLPRDEPTYLQVVREAYGELKAVARGAEGRVYHIVGMSGLQLSPSDRLVTPWGELLPSEEGAVIPGAEEAEWQVLYDHMIPYTSSVHICEVQTAVSISLTAQGEPLTPDREKWTAVQRPQKLLPVACALATDGEIAPRALWSMTLAPFAPRWSYVGEPMFLSPSRDSPNVDGKKCREIEEWCLIVDGDREKLIDTCLSRTMRALNERVDPADVLIDAVIAWESLVGTDAETSYRVTAALAKLVEDDVTKRSSVQKDLKGVYSSRSKLVHGEVVDGERMAEDARTAIRMLLEALRRSFARGEDWLSLPSRERANKLLLEEP